jgi:hypothetical protein
MRVFGVLLLLVGLAAFVLGERGIPRKREVARFGVLRASVTEQQPSPAARYAGVGLLVAGALATGMGLRRRA